MRYKTFAINLKSNEYRRDFMLAQREKSGLDINIFEAVTPETLNQTQIKYSVHRSLYYTGRILMDTEISCAISHMTLWADLIKDDGADYYLILEDDIVIQDDIAHILNKVGQFSLSNTIDFLKLSGQCERPKRKIVSIDESYDLYKFAYGPLDAACYLLSKKAATALLDYCSDMKAPIDILMDKSFEHGIPVYGVMPYPAKTKFCFDEHHPLYTDVGIRNSDFKKDRTVLVWLTMRYYRLLGSIKRKRAKWRLKTEGQA